MNMIMKYDRSITFHTHTKVTMARIAHPIYYKALFMLQFSQKTYENQVQENIIVKLA